MSWFITNLVSIFLLPPLNLLIVAIIGLFLWHKRPRVSRVLLTTSITLLWLLSTPYVSDSLLQSLEGTPHTINPNQQQTEAIVVLGGGTYFNAPEYGEDTVSHATLVRLRYAAKLHRQSGKPILVTGGTPLGNSLSEGAQMKAVLEQELNIPVQWVEGESDNTRENAYMSFEILKKANISKIYLITHAWHMPRAQQVFRTAGFTVIAAPTSYTTRYRTDLLSFLPRASALEGSYIFLHEMIGIAWYQLKSKL